MMGKVQSLGERFGWGVVISAAPYFNGIALATAGLWVFLLTLLFSLFGVEPGPPSQTGNPIAWLLYLLIMACRGWAIWAYVIAFFLFPLGAAWSLADILLARQTGMQDRFVGGVTGLALTILPILSFFWYGDQARQAIEPMLLRHPFTKTFSCSCD